MFIKQFFCFCFQVHKDEFTEDVLQPYLEGIEIKTDDQRLAEVKYETLKKL